MLSFNGGMYCDTLWAKLVGYAWAFIFLSGSTRYWQCPPDEGHQVEDQEQPLMRIMRWQERLFDYSTPVYFSFSVFCSSLRPTLCPRGRFQNDRTFISYYLRYLVNLRNRDEHWLSRPNSVVVIKRYFPEMCIIRLEVNIED